MLGDVLPDDVVACGDNVIPCDVLFDDIEEACDEVFVLIDVVPDNAAAFEDVAVF